MFFGVGYYETGRSKTLVFTCFPALLICLRFCVCHKRTPARNFVKKLSECLVVFSLGGSIIERSLKGPQNERNQRVFSSHVYWVSWHFIIVLLFVVCRELASSEQRRISGPGD